MAAITDQLFKHGFAKIKEYANDYEKDAKKTDPATLKQLKSLKELMKIELKALNKLLKDPVKQTTIAKDHVKKATELCKTCGVTL